MLLKRCWAPYYKQYGPTLNGTLFFMTRHRSHQKYYPIQDAMSKWHDIWNKKGKTYRGTDYATIQKNNMWYNLGKDLRHTMKPLVRLLREKGYAISESYILGYVIIRKKMLAIEDPINPDAAYWVKLHFDGRLVFSSNDKSKTYFIHPHTEINKATEMIHRYIGTQTITEGRVGAIRMYCRDFLFTAMPYIKNLFDHDNGLETDPRYGMYNQDYFDEDQYLLRRLRKKNNIILENSRDVLKHYNLLKGVRYQKRTKVNVMHEYLTYEDLETEAYLRGEELSEENMEDIFYSMV